MRTTLTLEKDVAAALERLSRARKSSLKPVVKETLRQGLPRVVAPPPAPCKPFGTQTLSVGRCLVSNVDNVADVLAVAENEPFK